ncbi:MAG: OmpH family outer membrane protein [Bacteroidales bacterium]|nr:OmpH family outer membrane protein [Bacteroidales bacterium]MBQ6710088.1 OmpH family outer membrane protein [Bacteroidales bacterium]
MKNTSLILSIISLIAVVVFGVLSLTKDGKKAEVAVEGEGTEVTAQKGDIVYIDLDRILMEYDMANDLRSVVETKAQNIQAEVTRRGQKLEKEVAAYQEKIQKGLMTRSVAEVQGQKLQQQEIDFNNYAAQKQQEINEEQVVMMNQLGDAIQTFINKYNEEKQYAMILTNSGGAPVITADPALDITEAVLAGLNEEYIKTKNQKSEE